MTATRITRESVETLIQSDGELRASRVSAEALIQTSPELRVSRVSVDVLLVAAAGMDAELAVEVDRAIDAFIGLSLTGYWGIPAGIS